MYKETNAIFLAVKPFFATCNKAPGTNRPVSKVRDSWKSVISDVLRPAHALHLHKTKLAKLVRNKAYTTRNVRFWGEGAGRFMGPSSCKELGI